VARKHFIFGLLLAQVLPGTGSSGRTGPVSPSVLATEMRVFDAAGRGTLELLILWRGSPGWFRKSGGASGGGGAGSSMGAGASDMIRTEWVSQGGVNLTVRFDPAARKAWLQDAEIVLNDANVLLVDGVDSASRPHVVRMLRIDPEYEATLKPVPVQAFIRRSPHLVDFLQCDVPAPGLQPYEQQVFEMWCSWVTRP
jgi:hypothetical protein